MFACCMTFHLVLLKSGALTRPLLFKVVIVVVKDGQLGDWDGVFSLCL
jgi:hypothetical protein